MARLGTGRLVCEDVDTNNPNVSASTTTTTPRRETIICSPLVGWVFTARAGTRGSSTHPLSGQMSLRATTAFLSHASPWLPIQRGAVIPANEVLERRRPNPRGLAAHALGGIE